MTKQVGFFVGESLMVQATDEAMVKKIEEFVKLREYEYIKLPGDGKTGEITYARLDCIPAFTFRELSSIVGLGGKHLTLSSKDDNGTVEDSKAE